MAHKKGVGSTKNGRDSESKRLGAKRADGQFVLDENAVKTYIAELAETYDTYGKVKIFLFFIILPNYLS